MGATRLYLVCPFLPDDLLPDAERALDDSGWGRLRSARIEEAVRLTEALCHLDDTTRAQTAHGQEDPMTIVGVEDVNLTKIVPATLFGQGVLDRVADSLAEYEASLVVVNTALSPRQQRNLETAWNCKVIDRTGLILEIFGLRARTKEGKMQVRLAQLTYQRSRLVRAWTHLERQRSTGKTGGPGERQIELDRRLIDDEITRLRKRLETVRQNRALIRKNREKTPYPVVALAGYTNAGKSSLFNHLTTGDVLAKDMLFATLDPTMRMLQLPNDIPAILSDTVGFIADLPTELVASFRATLEEVEQSDVVVHVVDISSPMAEAEMADVDQVLKDLGINAADPRRVLIAFNKVDSVAQDVKDLYAPMCQSTIYRPEDYPTDSEEILETDENTHKMPWEEEPEQNDEGDSEPLRLRRAVMISALTGEGMDELRAEIKARLVADYRTEEVAIDMRNPQAAQARAWLFEYGDIRAEQVDQDNPTYVMLTAALRPAQWGQFYQKFNSLKGARA